MNPHDGSGTRRDHRFEQARIDGVCAGRHIAKYRLEADPLESVRGRDKGQRGNDDFSPKTHPFGCQLQAHRSVAHRDAVFRAGETSDPVFEFSDVTAVVRESPAAQDFADPLVQMPLVPDVWPADVKKFDE